MDIDKPVRESALFVLHFIKIMHNVTLTPNEIFTIRQEIVRYMEMVYEQGRKDQQVDMLQKIDDFIEDVKRKQVKNDRNDHSKKAREGRRNRNPLLHR